MGLSGLRADVSPPFASHPASPMNVLCVPLKLVHGPFDLGLHPQLLPLLHFYLSLVPCLWRSPSRQCHFWLTPGSWALSCNRKSSYLHVDSILVGALGGGYGQVNSEVMLSWGKLSLL